MNGNAYSFTVESSKGRVYTEAEWRIYASVNHATTDSGLPVRHQAILWTNDGILLEQISMESVSYIIIQQF